MLRAVLELLEPISFNKICIKLVDKEVMLLITSILSLALIAVGGSREPVNPSNTAVAAGKQFYLVCDHQIGKTVTTIWKFLRIRTFADRVIYNGTHLSNQLRGFQVINTENGLSNLTKFNANENDSGTYKCIYTNGSYNIESWAQVIVFDTDPMCNPSEANVLEGQNGQISCSAHYTGSISPAMKWSNDSDVNITDIPGSSNLISLLRMNATRRYNNVTFICTTYFKQPNITNDSQTDVRRATNAPTYEHQCTHRLNVLFEPGGVEINPKKDIYTVGDTLFCNANGNPSPTYEWTEVRSNRVVSRESSLLVESTAMSSREYKCTATNNATGKQKSVFDTITISGVINSTISGIEIVRNLSIAAGIVFGALCFVAVSTVWIKRQKSRCCRNTTPQHDATTNLENSDHPSSNYETIENSETQINIESFGVQGVRPTLAESEVKPTDINYIAAENRTPSSVQRMIQTQGCTCTKNCTCYSALGDRSTPPGTAYESLNNQQPASNAVYLPVIDYTTPAAYEHQNKEGPDDQGASPHRCGFTTQKASSNATNVGVCQNPDYGLYANVN